MQDLFIITVFFIVAYIGLSKALWNMMAEGGAFDMVSDNKFTAFKDNLYGKSNKGKMLCKILGDCAQCFTFWFSWLWAVAYAAFTYLQGAWCLGWASGIIWVLVFVGVNTYLGLLTLTFKKKQNGV